MAESNSIADSHSITGQQCESIDPGSHLASERRTLPYKVGLIAVAARRAIVKLLLPTQLLDEIPDLVRVFCLRRESQVFPIMHDGSVIVLALNQ